MRSAMTKDETPRQLTALLPAPFLRPEQPLDDAIAQCRAAANQYQDWLRSVPDPLLHLPVTPGKWSPAEHADHVIKAARLFATLMENCAQGLPVPEPPMAWRWPDGRLLAPDLILPTPGKSREELEADFEGTQNDLEEAARRVDAAGKLAVPCVPTGIFAPLTPVEAIQMTGGHYSHHAPKLLLLPD
ncbi:MAG: DinB family protein [Acidobacteria bacterium]|nr:DinB family protein [Acidobacteriota bacterium]